MSTQDITQRQVEITAADLPLACPMPKMNLWNAHPKVRIALDAEGKGHCPYCGTEYTLTGGIPKGHH